MQAILPGKPQAQLQTACTGCWEGQLVVAYISGNSIVVCNGPDSLLQTICVDDGASSDEGGLVAIAYHGESGKIAVATGQVVHVYALREEIKGQLRWSLHLTLPLPGLEEDESGAKEHQKDHQLRSHQDGHNGDLIRTLSWGSDEELLVGSRILTLFSTHLPSVPSSPDPSSDAESTKNPQLVWTRDLPSPVTHAAFSPSTSLLATISLRDCLVKIWRRLSLDPPSFDYSYLPHPAAVTHLEWRPAASDSHADEDILYTLCADGKLRVWKPGSPHNIDILSLHAELDTFAAIRPHNESANAMSTRRYAFLIPEQVFNAAAEYATKVGAQDPKTKHAIEYLKELAPRHPDMVFVMDNQGHMSAWGLENVACKRRNSIIAKPEARNSIVSRAEFFHAAHVEGTAFAFDKPISPFEDNARILCFRVPDSPGDIALLLHHFDGRMQWWQGPIQRLFDPSPRRHRMRLMADWTGHSSSIKKVIGTASGKALISRTDLDETIVWQKRSTKSGITLVRKSRAKLNEHIHRTVLLRDGNFVVFLHHDSISLWDARQSQLLEIARCSYSVVGKPIALVVLPQADPSKHTTHLATMTTEMHGVVWELELPTASMSNGLANGTAHDPSMRQFCIFELDKIDDLSYFLPVDPAGSAPVVSGVLDSFAQDAAISWTSTGLLQTWTAKVDTERSSVDWLNLSKVETGISEPYLGSGTSIRKAALVDKSRSTLTIWDTRSERLDFEETFPNQTIQDLDWASTPDNQSILAVGFPHAVFVYTQLRYDYVNERPAWTRIKEVGIRHLTPHPIGDSVWLGSGNLVIGSGNQLFVVSETIDPRADLSSDMRPSAPHKTSDSIYDIVRTLNGPLPVFHPQFISQCVLAGKTKIVHRILLALHKTLKFYTEGDELDSFQGTTIEDFMSTDTVSAIRRPLRALTDPLKLASDGATRLHKSFSKLELNDTEPAVVNEDVASALTALLTEKSIPQLSGTEQFNLADIVECIGFVDKHRRSIDENAARFLLFWRESLTRTRQFVHPQHSPATPGAITWREMVWAYHSSSQDILVSTITSHHKGRLEWSHARDAGMFMWLTDREALIAQFEAIARNAYTNNEPKNPVDCSLYYLALHKKAVLQGLWRMATWSREQGATTRLLKNDFTDPRWKTAAAKNAYALMGKRRFEYAAAFFLLGDDLRSAVGVLSNQLGDMQLAIAVARVYGGDDSPVLKDFLQSKVLPAAAQQGNRWQATWCYWLLGQRSSAVRALVSPLHSLLDPPGTPTESLQAKSFLNDDPALVVLYSQLREKSLQTLKGALMISGKEEWSFITKTANLLLRMGCDILALDLVRNWEFMQQQISNQEAREFVGDLPSHNSPRKSLQNFEMDPRKFLRRRSSMVVADLPEVGVAAPAPSMLDQWDTPVSMTNGNHEPRSALDAVKKEEPGQRGNDTTISNDTAKEDKVPPPPFTQFQEPSANSLLDSFGF